MSFSWMFSGLKVTLKLLRLNHYLTGPALRLRLVWLPRAKPNPGRQSLTRLGDKELFGPVKAELWELFSGHNSILRRGAVRKTPRLTAN